MSTPVITFAEIKTALTAGGYPVAPGSAWQGQDAGSYTGKYVPDVSYAAGVQPDIRNANYGVAYPSVLPPAIGNAVGGANYSVTVAVTPLTGAHPLAVTATATETGDTATSYSWNWGDGNTTTTTIPTANHSYAAAGTFTVHLTPTVNGVAKSPVAAAAPAVVS